MTCVSVTSQRPLADLARGLRDADPIVYRDNGNRASDGAALWPASKRSCRSSA